MKLKNQVCSLELSKQLEKLGVKQNSFWYWFNPFKNQGWELVRYLEWDFNMHHEFYRAYSVAELGEMLPEDYKITLMKDNREITVGLWNLDKKWGKERHCSNFEAKTEADARAKMLIYLIENKTNSLLIEQRKE